MFRPTYTSTASQRIWLTVVIVIVAVHLLFKWNIYLSLYVIGFLLSKIDFLVLSSKYAVEACDINKCC